jgi:hypothetical protein
MKYLKMLGLAVVAAAALMAFVGAGTASATTLAIGGVAQNKAVTLEATLLPGTSALLKDEFGTTTDTCLSSTVEGTTENRVSPETTRFTGAVVGGKINTLDFTQCTHTTTVLAPGSLHVTWISGTDNGTVTSIGAEVTVQSTFFGASAVCKTGEGTDIGTLTGKTLTTEHAIMDINAKINCGILGSSSWTGTYKVTSPTGLSVKS